MKEKVSVQSLGGKARAEALSKTQLRSISSKAASARWHGHLPKASHDGILNLGDSIVPCAVLEDGTRVLTQAGFIRVLGRSNPSGRGTVDDSSESAERLPPFLSSKSIQPFISGDLASASRPVVFITKQGIKAFGYKAELLPLVCDVFLHARDAHALPSNQLKTARQCEILVRSLAKVGIIGLVDEATGYQRDRAKEALQQILSKYIREELAAWVKRFPDEFYQEMYRIKGWSWNGMSKNRFSCVANYTRDIVYERLVPGLLKELEAKNPVTEIGVRKAKHHQYLSSDVGNPALSQHLHTVIALMRVSSTWSSFMALLNKALPKRGDTLQLNF